MNARTELGLPLLVGILLAAAGCESFRLHDAGRLEMAKETAKLASEIGSSSAGVFGAMDDNLDTVSSAQSKLRRLTDQHELDTFKNILNRLDADRLANRLVRAIDDRLAVRGQIASWREDAMRGVNEALDRQKLISELLADTAAGRAGANTPQQTLKRIEGRLKWLDTVFGNLKDVHERTSARTPSGGPTETIARAVASTSGAVTANEESFRRVLGAAQRALKQANDDERVSAALQLVRRAAEETAGMEQSRLLELRRYVAEIERLDDRLAVRDRISVCNLVTAAVGHLYGATSDPAKLERVWNDLKQTGRFECLDGIDLTDGERAAAVRRRWQGRVLPQYVGADIQDRQDKATAPELVAAVGILLFHERRMFDAAQLDLARAAHRHSIRLSRVNAQQRIDLVHQLSEGLAIYYRGGIKPETVAELILFAGQVGALYTIGAR